MKIKSYKNFLPKYTAGTTPYQIFEFNIAVGDVGPWHVNYVPTALTVFVNGVRLSDDSYIAIDNKTITLKHPIGLAGEITFIVYNAVSVGVSKATVHKWEGTTVVGSKTVHLAGVSLGSVDPLLFRVNIGGKPMEPITEYTVPASKDGLLLDKAATKAEHVYVLNNGANLQPSTDAAVALTRKALVAKDIAIAAKALKDGIIHDNNVKMAEMVKKLKSFDGILTNLQKLGTKQIPSERVLSATGFGLVGKDYVDVIGSYPSTHTVEIYVNGILCDKSTYTLSSSTRVTFKSAFKLDSTIAIYTTAASMQLNHL